MLTSEKFIPLSEQQAESLVKKYADELVLWRRFWDFMAQQIEAGAQCDYVLQSSEVLEKVWSDSKLKTQEGETKRINA